MEKKPTNLLVVLDGWGVAPRSEGNAVALAHKPYFDGLVNKFPYTELNATGLAVGLGENERSGSEAGHFNIGAGRIVKQDSQIITEEIESGAFFHNQRLISTVAHAVKHNVDFHLMGLLSDSDSPHSDPEHLYALMDLAKAGGVREIYLHLFTDGRDAYERGSEVFLRALEHKIKDLGMGKIATMGGRYFAMDRVKHWDRMQRAYDAMVLGEGERFPSAEAVLKDAYQKGITDEFIPPVVLVDDAGEPIAKIKNHDSVIFFNLRGDRARQMTKLLSMSYIPDYPHRAHTLDEICMCTLADFGKDLPVRIAYYSQEIEGTIPSALEGRSQLFVAEAEKYPHVTYFINGGHNHEVDGEERLKLPSLNVSTYADAPEMSAGAVTGVITKAIAESKYDFILVNFANADMVGHTGNLPAAVKAVEFLDGCLEKIVEPALASGGTVIITADHGNADEMIDLVTGRVSTMHSKNPVPFIVAKKMMNKENCILRPNGVLGNVAPTLLELMGVEKPQKMVLPSLIEKIIL